jgi:large subunit ribosomal protein L4
MVKAKVYNSLGEMIEEKELDAKFFGVKVKPEVVQQVVEIQMANSRTVLAHTKGRAEVRGGGKKPWKQKGTGRARHGSSRSPIWVGGGVTFGPTKERNFEKSLNKKVKKLALQMVLADKLNHDRLILIKDLALTEGKTKLLASIIKKLPVTGKSTLIALDVKDEKIFLAARNLVKVNINGVANLNIVDVLKNEYFLLPVSAVEKLVKHYSSVK